MGINEKELYEKISNVVSFVCRNPLIFVSETDVHTLMMKALMEIKCIDPFQSKYKTKVTIGKNNKGGVSQDMYKTMLVHREYGHKNKPRSRSDIVIFDEQDVKTIDDPINLKNDNKYLTPKYIFEFGTDKSAGSEKVYKKHLEGDFEKLSECKNDGNGFLIHIHRNYTRSAPGTGNFKRNEEKYKRYEKITTKVWEKWCNKKKLKALVFFVQIGVPDYYTPSKIQMFNPYSTSVSGDWENVSLDKIESKIMKNLLKK
jgi:hypothetical protein